MRETFPRKAELKYAYAKNLEPEEEIIDVTRRGLSIRRNKQTTITYFLILFKLGT